jgi:hypothetical protein
MRSDGSLHQSAHGNNSTALVRNTERIDAPMAPVVLVHVARGSNTALCPVNVDGFISILTMLQYRIKIAVKTAEGNKWSGNSRVTYK